MLQSNSSPRETTSRPLSRLVTAATLAAFLVAQSWIVCAPLCLLQAHARAVSQYQTHPLHCHSNQVIQSELPATQSLGSMIPARAVPLLPPPRVVAVRFAEPLPAQLHQIPSADPPPPRSV
jgi:hypothetical protein